MHDHFQTMARYNRWANSRLYDACGMLPDAGYRAPRQAYFGSIHATLNHILVGDRAWLGRIEDVDSGITALDQMLYESFEALRDAREQEDERIMALADRLDAAKLESVLRYRNMAGEAQQTPLRWVLTHFFNHQTHHRGQVHDMLSQTEVSPPPLDLIYFLR